jgi:hypothetical protein
MSMLEPRRVFTVCGQGTSARRSSRYARAAHRQQADMEPCTLGGLERFASSRRHSGRGGL